MRKTAFLILLSTVTACSDSLPPKTMSSENYAVQPADETYANSPKGTAKVKSFNKIINTIENLSRLGVGELGDWKDDQMGGFFSVTPYYELQDGTPANNMMYAVTSEKESNIERLELVLNINNSNKENALKKFSQIVSKTYDTLGLPTNQNIVSAALKGKQVKEFKDDYSEAIQYDKVGRTDTYKFIIKSY